MDDKTLEQLLREEEERKATREAAQESLKDALAPEAAAAEQAQTARSEKVRSFSLNVDLDDAIPDEPADAQAADASAADTGEASEASQETDKPARKSKKGGKGGCLKKLLYTLVILAFAVTAAAFMILYLIDFFGLNRSGETIDVEVPSGASTAQIAEILHDNGLIERPFCFRVYSRLSKADGKYQRGMFTLSTDMDYSDIVKELQTTKPRDTVDVTIPEGYTVPEIAKLLSQKEVCDEASFYDAVNNGDFDYDFVKAIKTAADGEEYAGRIYRLEGYLFPDTYNFYKNSTGQSAVAVMLKNFDQKLDTTLRAKITNSGMTIDEAVIFASVIQGEAASKEDMAGVSRVLKNRLAEGSGFPMIQCDSTRDYVTKILPSVSSTIVNSAAYDTYQRKGLPVGAINNPGLEAINAVFAPSEDPAVINCYFFATDYKTGKTYFTKTFAEHEAICRRYKIGAYG